MAGNVQRLGFGVLLKRASWVGIALVLVVAASRATAPDAATASTTAVAGTLNLLGTLNMVSLDAPCPAGMSASTICHSRQAQGEISGLGKVTQAYMYNGDPALCPGNVQILGYTTSFRVAGKGEIHFAVADAPICHTPEEGLTATQSFTVTGGSGIYTGVSGSGRVERAANFTALGAQGQDTWIGTLVVPGLDAFDLTPPTLSAATSKTVRARKGVRRVRVTYDVTATDNEDSQVPVTCAPRSGSRFPIGRTVVRCSATDTSGNTGNASFTVTVRRSR